ncbi:MAG TPA: hypothetical protein VM716_01295 [Gemmatimonadales bacterium]|nr:hypothetical protein [Gemmatimonadales bacterium]
MVSGRLLYGAAGRPLPNAWVVLHAVSPSGGGEPIDSARTDGRGTYTLTISRPDSSAVYVVSSWRAGIAYFSEPVPRDGASGRGARTTLRPLYVYDTSSTGPPLRLARRLVTVTRVKRDGSRDVLELIELENPGSTTRVAADTVRPTWAGAIPSSAIQFQLGQGDVSPQAVTLRGDSVSVYGPLPPRERKQLSYAYVLPATVRRIDLPIDQGTDELDLLLEDTAAVVTARALDSLGVEHIEGRPFARYRSRELAAGAALAIVFPEPRFSAEALVPWVVGLAGLALAIGFVVALRRPSRQSSSRQ